MWEGAGDTGGDGFAGAVVGFAGAGDGLAGAGDADMPGDWTAAAGVGELEPAAVELTLRG